MLGTQGSVTANIILQRYISLILSSSLFLCVVPSPPPPPLPRPNLPAASILLCGQLSDAVATTKNAGKLLQELGIRSIREVLSLQPYN